MILVYLLIHSILVHFQILVHPLIHSILVLTARYQSQHPLLFIDFKMSIVFEYFIKFQ